MACNKKPQKTSCIFKLIFRMKKAVFMPNIGSNIVKLLPVDVEAAIPLELTYEMLKRLLLV